MNVPFDLAIPHVGINPKKLIKVAQQYLCLGIFFICHSINVYWVNPKSQTGVEDRIWSLPSLCLHDAAVYNGERNYFKKHVY